MVEFRRSAACLRWASGVYRSRHTSCSRGLEIRAFGNGDIVRCDSLRLLPAKNAFCALAVAICRYGTPRGAAALRFRLVSRSERQIRASGASQQ